MRALEANIHTYSQFGRKIVFCSMLSFSRSLTLRLIFVAFVVPQEMPTGANHVPSALEMLLRIP